jgi:hypothetical protein
MSSKIHTQASAAYKKSVNIANSAKPMHDGVDTRVKLNSKAAHQLRRHNDKYSQGKAFELFMENYELQCGLRGSQSSRAMDAYKWAMKTHASFQKVNMSSKARGKAENEARILRDKNNAEKKKNAEKKNVEKKNNKKE